MLNPSDVYVSGGSDKLLVCWTDKVTKYDASSFYNWEQDNLPLHDLDERTHLAWEKFGHPTSALTGMSFIVSGDATDSCDPLFFTTLSSCINALPEVINCPILIEVASFGNLGGLNLSNKAFGPNGALEIINRNSSFGTPLTASGTGNNRISVATLDSAYTDYSLVSSISNGNTASVAAALTAGSACPLLANDAQNARLYTRGSNGEEIFISSGVSTSSYADARFVNPYVFCKKTDLNTPTLGRLTASLSSITNPWDIAATSVAVASKFEFDPFDKNRTVEKDNYDVSTVNYLTESELKWGTLVNDTPMTSFAYFNSLDYIKVNNCNGPIYIRNFNVDSQHAQDRGIEIKNSKVNLERCSVSRANKAGLYADSSEVNLLRGFVAFRNYELLNFVRTGIPFADKRLNYATQETYGAGIYAVNSTVNLKSTYDRDIQKASQASGASYYTNWASVAGASGIPLPSLGAIYCLSRNDIGIHAVNSNIIGGRTELGGVSTKSWNDALALTSELNTEAGIKLENSVVDYSGRLLLDGNYFGLDSANSKVYVDSVAARFNQATGYKFVNSEFVYNKDLYAGYFRGQDQNVGIETHSLSQVVGTQNNRDIECDNSVISPLYTSSMPSIYQAVYTASSFGKSDTGVAGDGTVVLPSIEATNNSKLDLISAHIDRSLDDLTGASEACYGAMIKATNNSTVICRGTHHYANVLLGPGTRVKSHKLAAAYAGNNSQILFQGPTAIAQVGIDALAEKNSTIDFGPHRNSENELLVSSFDLDSQGGNHTMVELHSVRSCLVANEQSQLKMTDLGSYEITYANSPSVSARSDNYTYPLTSQQSECASGGWMQLYPNANVDSPGVVPYAVGEIGGLGNPNRYKFQEDPLSNASTKYRYSMTFNSLDLQASGVTTGGMSVRAIGNSLVEATNVHFPCGWANCSGVVYDLDGSPPLPGPICSRLHIWNIADTSLLKASYLSISGVHPVDAAYHGPSGTWSNHYGAPSTTPDTSGLSILDYYGVNTVNTVLGKSSPQNLGPFRLYFSIDPAAKFLDASSSNLSGVIPQVLSQGYSFSGPASAVDNADYGASANYTSLLRKILVNGVQTNNWAASGFYYPSEIISNPNTTLVIVDDSGANAFANAKHNSVGKSLIGKRVNIFYPTDGFGGDSDTASTFGQGLLSVNNFDLKKDN